MDIECEEQREELFTDSNSGGEELFQEFTEECLWKVKPIVTDTSGKKMNMGILFSGVLFFSESL